MFKIEAVKILIVDDDESVRNVIQRRLSKTGYHCYTAENGGAALEIFKSSRFDLVLSDINMPGMDGVRLLNEIRLVDATVSVIMVTAVMDMDTAINALRNGAYDYITKPIEHEKLLISVANGIEKTRLLRENIAYQNNLERMVRERTIALEEKSQRLESFFVETTMALVSAVEAKDKYTEGHSRRVADYSKQLALMIGLSEHEADRIHVAGILHDIGKIGIPDAILHKPGFFTKDERDIMQTHPGMSADILAKIADFNDIMEMVLHHHERYDGNGYPDRLAGDGIPLGARILSVADAYDAMTSKRPYRPAMPQEKAIDEIKEGRGTQVDPGIADAFLELIESGKLTNMKK